MDKNYYILYYLNGKIHKDYRIIPSTVKYLYLEYDVNNLDNLVENGINFSNDGLELHIYTYYYCKCMCNINKNISKYSNFSRLKFIIPKNITHLAISDYCLQKVNITNNITYFGILSSSYTKYLQLPNSIISMDIIECGKKIQIPNSVKILIFKNFKQYKFKLDIPNNVTNLKIMCSSFQYNISWVKISFLPNSMLCLLLENNKKNIYFPNNIVNLKIYNNNYNLNLSNNITEYIGKINRSDILVSSINNYQSSHDYVER
jgi:hypothetical protein